MDVALNGWNKRPYSTKRDFQFSALKQYQISDLKLYYCKSHWMNRSLSIVPRTLLSGVFYLILQEGYWGTAQRKGNQGSDSYSY